MTVDRGDTLWSLAETHLGDGDRWVEIAAANEGRVMSDGSMFHSADLIRPGWQLLLSAPTPERGRSGPGETDPADAHRYRVRPGDTLWDIAEERLGDSTDYPAIYAASRAVEQPGGARLTDPDVINVGWDLVLPVTPETGDGPGARGFVNPDPAVGRERGDAGRRGGTEHDQDASPPPTDPGRHREAGRAPATVPTEEPGEGASGAPDSRPPQIGLSPPAPAPSGARPDEASGSAVEEPGPGDVQPGWLLPGLAGGTALLAGGLLVGLRQRRREQWRHRLPGRMIAGTPPELAPVEKAVVTVGEGTAATVELMHEVLARMGARCALDGAAVPAAAAAELTGSGLVLHLTVPADLPAPWQGARDRLRWTWPVGADVDDAGPQVAGQPAPYPLLAAVGTSDHPYDTSQGSYGGGDHDAAGGGGSGWLLNFEELGSVTITGDLDRARSLVRYVVAELAVNPWSALAVVDCVGVAPEGERLNPRRVRYHPADAAPEVAGEVLADAVTTAGHASTGRVAVRDGRVRGVEGENWPARLLLVDSNGEEALAQPVAELAEVISGNSGATGTGMVLIAPTATGSPTAPASGTTVEVTPSGRLLLPAVGLDLAAEGLTKAEAAGIATLMAASEVAEDADIPAADASADWAAYTNAAGALRAEHTLPRDVEVDEYSETTTSILEDADETYLAAGAATSGDLAALAPRVSPRVKALVEDTDPTLDSDLAGWHAEDSRRAKLAVLGPMRARAHGDPRVAGNSEAHLTAVLAYLATRGSRGATVAELRDAFGIDEGTARNTVTLLRKWLGKDPATGLAYIPDARHSNAAKVRGRGCYQVNGLLWDADLFLRLRRRGQARGGHAGRADYTRALELVGGAPFDSERPQPWLDPAEHQHLLVAVVDVAHTLITHALGSGEVSAARAVLEIALAAAPDDEPIRLDLTQVLTAEGQRGAAAHLVANQVSSPLSAEGVPTDPPARTRELLTRRRRTWVPDEVEAGRPSPDQTPPLPRRVAKQ